MGLFDQNEFKKWLKNRVHENTMARDMGDDLRYDERTDTLRSNSGCLQHNGITCKCLTIAQPHVYSTDLTFESETPKIGQRNLNYSANAPR